MRHPKSNESMLGTKGEEEKKSKNTQANRARKNVSDDKD